MDVRDWSIRLSLLSLVLVSGGCGRDPAAPPQPRRLRMVVRSPNGITHDLLTFYRRTMPSVQVTMDVVAGSDAVAAELQHGRAELGFAQAGYIYTAFRTGVGDTPHPFDNLRGIAVIGRSAVWIAVAGDSPLTSIGELRGKRLGVVNDSATVSSIQMILKAYGVSQGEVTFLPMREGQRMSGLESGALDAAIFLSTATPEFMDWHRRVGVRLLETDTRVIAPVLTRFPFMTLETIARETFPALPADRQTIALDYVVASRADLDDNFVYEVTRGFVGQFADFARRNPRDLLVDPEQAPATPIPLHAGAERYYREQQVLR